jgi:hypothetical protein
MEFRRVLATCGSRREVPVSQPGSNLSSGHSRSTLEQPTITPINSADASSSGVFSVVYRRFEKANRTIRREYDAFAAFLGRVMTREADVPDELARRAEVGLTGKSCSTSSSSSVPVTSSPLISLSRSASLDEQSLVCRCSCRAAVRVNRGRGEAAGRSKRLRSNGGGRYGETTRRQSRGEEPVSSVA